MYVCRYIYFKVPKRSTAVLKLIGFKILACKVTSVFDFYRFFLRLLFIHSCVIVSLLALLLLVVIVVVWFYSIAERPAEFLFIEMKYKIFLSRVKKNKINNHSFIGSFLAAAKKHFSLHFYIRVWQITTLQSNKTMFINIPVKDDKRWRTGAVDINSFVFWFVLTNIFVDYFVLLWVILVHQPQVVNYFLFVYVFIGILLIINKAIISLELLSNKI